MKKWTNEKVSYHSTVGHFQFLPLKMTSRKNPKNIVRKSDKFSLKLCPLHIAHIHTGFKRNTIKGSQRHVKKSVHCHLLYEGAMNWEKERVCDPVGSVLINKLTISTASSHRAGCMSGKFLLTFLLTFRIQMQMKFQVLHWTWTILLRPVRVKSAHLCTLSFSHHLEHPKYV